MRSGAAQVQALDGGAITAPTGDGTHEQNLVESKLSVVEACLRRLQLHLIRPNVESLRDALRESLVRSRRYELHVELQAIAVEALHLDVRRCRVPAVLGVVVGPLQVVEGWRDAEIRVARGSRPIEGQRAARDYGSLLDVAHRPREFRIQLDRDRVQ